MDRATKARKFLATQQRELLALVEEASRTAHFEAAFERLARWKGRTVDGLRLHVHDKEGDRLAKTRKTFFSGDPSEDLLDEARMYEGFLHALDLELKKHPKHVFKELAAKKAATVDRNSASVAGSTAVFLVHGHDEVNLLRLKEIVADRWKLDPVVLSGKAGRGRTLIEKFEGEAKQAGFAFVLMSPDDEVGTGGGVYAQARPNVVFELGWFYGRLGRDRVCILFKKGTHIHSDLDGVSRIEFVTYVNEKIDEMECELVTAKLLKKGGHVAGG